MGRDLRRLYKEVTCKELPLQDFSVQRPIELVEKELSDTVYYTRESDGDVKYFLRKKVPEAGHRPLWQLTSHGDDHCPTVVPGDMSFEELKLQVSALPSSATAARRAPFPPRQPTHTHTSTSARAARAARESGRGRAAAPPATSRARR
jgi:hypothetical protein